MNVRRKINVLFLLIFTVLLAVLFVEAIPQDPLYHQFSDQKTFWGIPNGWNVLSNIPFIIIGIVGWLNIRYVGIGREPGLNYLIARLFFFGLILTGIGSGYYHLSPSNETLVWDRLPMTITFMAFFSFVLSMHLGERVSHLLLWPLIIVGVGSVFYWAYTESVGMGDLRFYAVIQFLPMLLIPAIIFLFPVMVYKKRYVWGVIAVYLIAKFCEYFDGQMHELLSVSGHSLKHIVAAFSGVAFYYAIKSVNPAALNKLR